MKREIKRSKSLRAWNKYKKLIIIGVIGLALILALIIGLIVGLSKKSNKDDKKNPSQGESQLDTSAEGMEDPTQESIGINPFTGEPIYPEPTTPETTMDWSTTEAVTTTAEQPTVTEAPTSAQSLVKTPTKEDFTHEAFFDDAVIVGDSFVAGIDTYQHLKSSKLVYDNNWTTGKASNAVDRIAATNAKKVFLEIGLNDLNTGRTGEKVFESYQELVNDIKAKMPNATIYVISTFPVTSGFEARENTGVKNSEVKNLNNLLAGMGGVTYLDVAASLSNSDGSLQPDLSTSGYNIKNTYYAFILNLIAEMCQ